MTAYAAGSLGAHSAKSLLTIEEIRQRYPDEWVCLEVTQEDEMGQPLAGRLIVHSREKRRVVQAAKAFRDEHPKARGFLFYTGELIPEGQVVILPFHSSSPTYAGTAGG
jgi:hypothetical protein